MNLKKAVLEQLGRDELKAICAELELEDVDLRSVESMRAKVSRAHRATVEVLTQYLSEAQAKAVAERIGMDPTGRKSALIQRMIALNAGGELELTCQEDGPDAPAPQARRSKTVTSDITEQYRYPDQAVQRPDIGVQDQFQTKKLAKTYRYDSSLDPALSWDEQRERDLGEWLLGLIERAAKHGEKEVFAEPQEWNGGGVRVASTAEAVACLKQISKPFLNWAGKAERSEINVPTVPLFVHERHSTKAILDGIRHRKAKGSTLDLFGDPQMDIRENLEAYEHMGPWQNRMILGDSLSVMNSLLEYEGMGGQVQMIYIDPPYGVKFGSNFQPFVRKRDVKHGDDDEMTREPEMVKAYRDTWEVGLHSYLTYMRDRLCLAKDLLNESGSVFVQISDDNVHHVRELLDDVYGVENFVSVITFKSTSGLGASGLKRVNDFVVWYARRKESVKYRQIYSPRTLADAVQANYNYIESPNGRERRSLSADEKANPGTIPSGWRIYTRGSLISGAFRENTTIDYIYAGRTYHPGSNRCWKTTKEGLDGLAAAGRLDATDRWLYFKRYLKDFPATEITNVWDDTGGSFATDKIYVVQTASKVIERCLLMTTDPGDLVLDPTCGSGTTAYVAEQWGRRWVTVDTSRVPLALARQRMLTATFPYYELKDPSRGPAGGFVYRRKQNKKGEEVGGLVPHITLKSIANDEPPAMEVLVDRPEEISGVTRVTGPFVAEATIAPVQSLQVYIDGDQPTADVATHLDRMTEVLRQSKTLHLPGNRELTLAGIRRTVDTEYLHAEATEGTKRIAIVFGPADGAVSQSLVYEGAREAHYLKYDGIYFFGFAVEPEARKMIEEDKKLRIPAAYVAVTPDVAMSDLLKTTKASEIFSITGLPDFKVKTTAKKGPEGQPLYQVALEGVDVFDPESLETESVEGASVPCWMLDTDYDGMSFYASQVFFPKTSAWDNLQKSLKATFDDSIWEHLAGTVSEPFVLGSRRRVAVKVIDERGNELLRVKDVE